MILILLNIIFSHDCPQVSNMFIMSLAVADMTVGVATMAIDIRIQTLTTEIITLANAIIITKVGLIGITVKTFMT